MIYQPENLSEKQAETPLAAEKTSLGKRVGQVILSLFLVLTTAASALAWRLPEIHTVEVSQEQDLKIAPPQESAMTGEAADIYKTAVGQRMNILLIGVDEDGYEKGRSDSMILITLKKGSNEIKMTSFTRDTMALVPSRDSYEKLNHSYMYGGPIELMQAFNMNFDLNVKDFVAFDFEALVTLIDAVDGVPAYVDEGAFYDINKSAEALWAQPLTHTGWQILTGRQALLYARVRMNSGDDAGRSGRQREILQEVFKRLAKKSKNDIVSLADKLIPTVRTSFTYGDVVDFIDYFELIKGSASFSVAEFPYNHGGYKYEGIWYEAAPNPAQSVIRLHRDIYGVEDYTLSRRAERIAEHIKEVLQTHE